MKCLDARSIGIFSDIDEHLKGLSAKGDTLEWLNAMIDFELFRPDLVRRLPA